jgi:hypothetical protein
MPAVFENVSPFTAPRDTRQPFRPAAPIGHCLNTAYPPVSPALKSQAGDETPCRGSGEETGHRDGETGDGVAQIQGVIGTVNVRIVLAAVDSRGVLLIPFS